MKCLYLKADPNMCFGPAHVWMKACWDFTTWYVCQTDSVGGFTSSGCATVDDFGNLVRIEK